MSGRFNENTRVQVPAAIHLSRLGYTYLDRIDPADYDASTNILTTVFKKEDGFTKNLESLNAESAALDKKILSALKKLEFVE